VPTKLKLELEPEFSSFFFRYGTMAAADIFYPNKKYFPRVLAILYLPCTF
jgi:hypothetical protein